MYHVCNKQYMAINNSNAMGHKKGVKLDITKISRKI